MLQIRFSQRDPCEAGQSLQYRSMLGFVSPVLQRPRSGDQCGPRLLLPIKGRTHQGAANIAQGAACAARRQSIRGEALDGCASLNAG